MKILNFVGENLHMFWTTWGISMKFLRKKWLMIALEVKSLHTTFCIPAHGLCKSVACLFFWIKNRSSPIWIVPFDEHCDHVNLK